MSRYRFFSGVIVCIVTSAFLYACDEDHGAARPAQPIEIDTGVEVDAHQPDDGEEADTVESHDASPTGDAESDGEPYDECDKDGDGHLSIACGGLDCDDNDPYRNPDRPEVCNGIDDNCNGVADEHLNCSFYAHTESGLYLIDPFKGTTNKEADMVDYDDEEISILDIDTHPSGNLYGISRTTLYVFNDAENYWVHAGTIGDVGDANGMAIDSYGIAYVTAENKIYKLDLIGIEGAIATQGLNASHITGATIPVEVMTITGGTYYSSGDCVVNKENTLFMTSKHDPEVDHLIVIDRATGAGTNIGPIGFSRVYGLTAGWDKLFGVTIGGKLIEIDPTTGQAELLHSFTHKRWYGMASTPDR